MLLIFRRLCSNQTSFQGLLTYSLIDCPFLFIAQVFITLNWQHFIMNFDSVLWKKITRTKTFTEQFSSWVTCGKHLLPELVRQFSDWFEKLWERKNLKKQHICTNSSLIVYVQLNLSEITVNLSKFYASGETFVSFSLAKWDAICPNSSNDIVYI